MMNAFISMLMLDDMRYYFLQSYVNMVFRPAKGPERSAPDADPLPRFLNYRFEG
jgi:hypothetical protein